MHDFVSEGEGDARNYEVAVTGGARYSITLNGCVTEETGDIGAPPVTITGAPLCTSLSTLSHTFIYRSPPLTCYRRALPADPPRT